MAVCIDCVLMLRLTVKSPFWMHSTVAGLPELPLWVGSVCWQDCEHLSSWPGQDHCPLPQTHAPTLRDREKTAFNILESPPAIKRTMIHMWTKIQTHVNFGLKFHHVQTWSTFNAHGAILWFYKLCLAFISVLVDLSYPYYRGSNLCEKHVKGTHLTNTIH